MCLELLYGSLITGVPPGDSYKSLCSRNRSVRDMECVRLKAAQTLDDELATVLIISDPNECNENFLIVLKCILDNVYLDAGPMDEEGGFRGTTYETISGYALKLLTLNLFVKNCRFCLGKMLLLLNALCDHEPGVTVPEVYYQGQCLKEYLCVCLLLLLKTKNQGDLANIINVEADMVFNALRLFDFIPVFSKFIAANMKLVLEGFTSFVLLKFSCDIFFEYLYHVVVVTPEEYSAIVALKLVPVAIYQLVDNENFNTYDIDAEGYENEDQLTAYEQFKIILLINEQCLMGRYPDNLVVNSLNPTTLAGFTNLAIYYLNREELTIVKILVLKFLYLIFTTTTTSTAVYTNDLKILMDICIRELNDLDYTNPEIDLGVLVIDYLRVLYPLVSNSQVGSYKVQELKEVLEFLKAHSSEAPHHGDVIASLANSICEVEWFAEACHHSLRPLSPLRLDDSTVLSSITQAFTRVASVRTSTRADYHKHTRTHNIVRRNLRRKSGVLMATANNGNVFLKMDLPADDEEEEDARIENEANILDLPLEYVRMKPLPRLPVPQRRREVYNNNEASSLALLINLASLLVRKALRKKAPPPPTPPLQATRLASDPPTPPPPPPPRRKRHVPH